MIGTKLSARRIDVLDAIIGGALVVTTLIVAFTKFWPVRQVMIPFYLLIGDPGFYVADVEIQNSILPANNILLMVLGWLGGPNLAQATPVLVSYILCSAINLTAVLLIAMRVFGLRKVTEVALFLVVVLLADLKFAQHLRMGLFYDAATPTSFAYCARWVFLYGLLSDRRNLTAATLFAMALFSLKAAWPCFALYGLTRIWARDLDLRDCVRLAIAAAPIALTTFIPSHGGAPDSAAIVYEAIKHAYADEDDPTYVPLMGIAAFAALGGFAFLWRDTVGGRKTGAVLGAAVALNALIIVGGLIYFNVLDRILPIPAIVWMSPLRGLEAGCLVVLMTFAAGVARNDGLTVLEKAAITSGVAILTHGFSVTLLVSFAFLAIGILSIVFRKVSAEKSVYGPFSGQRRGLADMCILVMLIFVAAYSLYKAGLPSFNVSGRGIVVERTFPTELEAVDVDSFGRSRVLLLNETNGVWEENWYANLYLGWSRASGPLYYVVSPEAVRTLKALNAASSEILKSLNVSRSIPRALAERAAALDIVLVVPARRIVEVPGAERSKLTANFDKIALGTHASSPVPAE